MTVWYAGWKLHTRQSSTQSDKYQVSHRNSYFSWWWAHSRPKQRAYQSSTQSDKYQVSHRDSYFSCWWAHSRPKHVEKINKHTKKNCAPSWLYLQDYTRMHGQKNKITQCHILNCTSVKPISFSVKFYRVSGCSPRHILKWCGSYFRTAWMIHAKGNIFTFK